MKYAVFTFTVLFLFAHLHAQNFISEKKEVGAFPIASGNVATTIYADASDDWLVQKAASLLQQDIEKVTGKKPVIDNHFPSAAKNIIIIGSIEKSPIIRQLVAEKKLNAGNLKGKWEAFTLQTINHPLKGVDQALVIAGSDKRGTAYGVFELSKQMGVSPWYWWADVPVKKKEEVYVKNGVYHQGPPSVQYRGIFINDEAPAFSGWTKEKFGGVNHKVYEKIFELLLRLKGNYLWPAMWGNAFNDDDTLNPVLANKYGIVMGTSHHEPMLRAQQEWKRYGHGAWDYTKNDSVLRAFWRKGIENMDHHESIVTIGMRGDGDMPMTQGTAIDLLEKIVADQRKIIAEVTGKPAAATPQMWALYKEVQDYYDKGMRVPEDVTLLLCDDNWGNIRKLPKLTDKPRSGGYGIYYHFDYVGGPRNYKWINTNNIARVWEQMHLAYAYGVNKVWVVNVGDLKPMEFPISFFLDYAWNTKKWNEDNLTDYYTQWAAEQFGNKYAQEIGDLLRKYAQYASSRKPELLDANTYSFSTFADNDEWDRILKEWNDLQRKAEKINDALPAEYKDAYFELVLHPIKAFANLNYMYAAVAKNKYYANRNSSLADKYADEAKHYYQEDSLITIQYNSLANGKWNHMMDQTHIGYTYWQEPRHQKMPDVKYVTQTEEAVPPVEEVTRSAKNLIPNNTKGNVFYEQDGVVSIEAAHWTKAVDAPNIKWKVIPDIGRDGSGITTFPVTDSARLSANSPHVEYDFYTYDTSKAKIDLYFSPTLNFHNAPNGLQFAVSVDNQTPQIISLNKEDNTGIWNNWVANNIIIKTAEATINQPGKHVLKYWMISPAIVLQKIVVDLGGLQKSYLGPTETKK